MALKRLPDDFRDFIAALNANDVRYLLIGGWAVGIHGHPRATKDIDFLVSADDANIDRLRRSLFDFGGPALDVEDFRQPGNVFRMGRPPIQIDIVSTASGVEIDDCWPRREIVAVDGVEIAVISKPDLIRNKLASGRTRDRADAEALE
jgi:hypothetical protein